MDQLVEDLVKTYDTDEKTIFEKLGQMKMISLAKNELWLLRCLQKGDLEVDAGLNFYFANPEPPKPKPKPRKRHLSLDGRPFKKRKKNEATPKVVILSSSSDEDDDDLEDLLFQPVTDV